MVKFALHFFDNKLIFVVNQIEKLSIQSPVNFLLSNYYTFFENARRTNPPRVQRFTSRFRELILSGIAASGKN